jgi:hypothetical protein
MVSIVSSLVTRRQCVLEVGPTCDLRASRRRIEKCSAVGRRDVSWRICHRQLEIALEGCTDNPHSVPCC